MDYLPSYLSVADLDMLITRALAEDIGPGDATTQATIPPTTTAEAHFLAKEDGVLAGLYVAEQVMHAVNPKLNVAWTQRDGAAVTSGTVFGTVKGHARSLLMAERLALNLLQRMSGIATATRALVEAAQPHDTRILDTRKTVPGLRLLDKWAVRLGGGHNHRLGLYDQILIKDNHIAAAGGIPQAIQAAQRWCRSHHHDLWIEIEARTLDEVDAIIATGGVDIVLLDNMVVRHADGTVDTSMLAEAVQRIGTRFQTEASGNVTLETVPAIAATGVDALSSGALTHSVKAMDISLKIQLQ